ncbi:MAG: hypothetical protein ACYDBB_18680 [Armatimonadota bacterium]
MISRTAYGSWQNNVRLANKQIELIATLDVGPRVIRFGFIDGPNVFKNFSDQIGGANEDEWQIRGGHRLWHAPEGKPRSYTLDNSPVNLEEVGTNGIRLTPALELENGIQKQMDIFMSSETNEVTVIHRLTNTGPWAIELAPWALSVMDAGGIEFIPLPEKRPHTEVLEPDFPLVFWPYTDLADPRIRFGSRYITLSQHNDKGPTKFGMLQQLGWAAYLVHGTLFVKYFDAEPGEVYPDYQCNFETYTNQDFLEVESLGPLTLLDPCETVEHVETWRLFADVPPAQSDDEIDRVIRPLVEG